MRNRDSAGIWHDDAHSVDLRNRSKAGRSNEHEADVQAPRQQTLILPMSIVHIGN
jgi:hypothetical protein